MDKKAAQKVYYWLWFSPILTISTLGLFTEIVDSEITAVFISAIWHLLLFFPAVNIKKKFVAWHARQALMLAGARTLVALVFYSEPIIAGVLLIIIWFFGTRWGQKEAKKGQCSLMRWRGVGLEPPLNIEVVEKENPKKPVRRSFAEPTSVASVKKIITPHAQPTFQSHSKNQHPSCPKCGTPEEEKMTLCGECGEAYAAEDLLKLRQLEYLLRQTQTWRGSEPYRKPYKAELLNLRARLFPPQQVEVKDEAPRRARPEPAPVKKAVLVPKPIPANPVAERVVEPAVKVVKSTPKPNPAPKPKPKRDSIQWGQLWQKATEMVVSGALLRGLLYLGAFMIVVSATILVIRFWDEFPQALQLILIAAVPTTFYILSWVVRSKLKLPQAATVLTAIGALMVAVDFAAVYQFGGLSERFDGNAYWFFASVITLIIYSITAWRVSGEVFDYLVLIGITNVILSFTRLLEMPYEWSAVAMVATGVAFFAFAAKFPHPNLPPRGEGAASLPPSRGDVQRIEGGGIALASRYYPHLLIIASLIFVSYIPDASAWAQSFAFFWGTLGYALMAWKFPRTIFAHATAWAFIAAVGFALFAIELPTAWYATAAGVLAIPYILGGKVLSKFTMENAEGTEILEKKVEKEKSWQRGYQLAANIAGFGLTSIAIFLGFSILFVEVWASVSALILVTGILVGLAYFYKKPILIFFSGGLFNIPFLFAIEEILGNAEVIQPIIWLMAIWGGLAIVYISLSLLLRKAEEYAQMLVFLAQLIIFPLIFGLMIFYDGALSQIPVLVSLGIVLLFYTLSAFLNHYKRLAGLSNILKKVPLVGQSFFVWATGFLFPIWLSLAWKESGNLLLWFGAVLAGLALVYIALGQFLLKKNKSYRFPLHIYSYILFFSGTLVAWNEQAALQITLYLVVISLAWLSYIYKRIVESTIAALLFAVSFQQSLELFALPEHAHSLAYILLASLVYIPIGNFLSYARKYQKEPRFEYPVLIIGYLMSFYALIASLFGRFHIYLSNYPLIGVEVSLIASILYFYSIYRYQKSYLFAKILSVLSALSFIIVFGQSLTLFNIPEEYLATAWIGLAFAYLLIERGIAYRKAEGWLRHLRFSYGISSAILAILGFILTAPYAVPALLGGEKTHFLLAIFAQMLVVAFVILAALLYRSSLPLYLEPFIALVPVTLIFVSYTEIAPHQYGIVWAIFALLHLVIASILDKNRIRYAHGIYLGSYFFSLFAILWTISDSATLVWTLGLGILSALFSALSVHFNRHYTWDEIVRLFFGKKENAFQKSFRSVFIWIAAWAFPIWIYFFLGQFEILYMDNQVELAWRGFVLALLAPAYIAIGLVVRRARREYTWSLFSAGYALTVIAAIIAFSDLKIAIAVLVLDAAVYALSAYIFKKAFWLYLTTILVPIISLLSLHYTDNLNASAISKTLMGLALLYLLVGWFFDRNLRPHPNLPSHGEGIEFLPPSGGDVRRTEGGRGGGKISAFALPFYAPAFALSAIALVTASSERNLAILIYLLGVFFYSISIKLFNETLFLYPAVWLFSVPYYLAMTLIPNLDARWYGLGWLPLIIFYILIGRFIFHKKPIRSPIFVQPAMPFYLLGYALSLILVALSATDSLALTLAFLAGAILYFVSGGLFRRFVWFYPGLLFVHLALFSYFTITPSGKGLSNLSPPFMVLTWAIALIGYAFSRIPCSKDSQSLRAKALTTKVKFMGHILTPSWAQPFFIFAVLDIFIWQAVAHSDFYTAVILAVGHALLLVLFAILWTDFALVYGALAFFLLAVGYQLHLAEVVFAESMTWLGGIGLGFYLLSRVSKQVEKRTKRCAIWTNPFKHVGIVLSTLAVIFSLPFIASYTSAIALSLAFAGMLYLAIAYEERRYYLGYFGMGMLLFSWALLLVVRDISEPQWYAIPASIYFTVMGELERKRGRGVFSKTVTGFGLAVLLVTSYAQSLGDDGFIYFVILLFEGVLVWWWGAVRRQKVPFFAGLGASILNVISQVILVVRVYDINRWIAILGVGLVLVVAAIFVEKQRETIIARSKEWSEKLDSWE